MIDVDPHGRGWDPYGHVTDHVTFSLDRFLDEAVFPATRPPGTSKMGSRGTLDAACGAETSAWFEADRTAEAILHRELDLNRTDQLADGTISGLDVARTVSAWTARHHGVIVCGASLPIRHLHQAMGRHDVPVIANRGVSGIDGFTSTAVGVASVHTEGPVVGICGDLTFLHDLSGLIIGPDEPQPPLTLVVVDNDGGGIFDLLEYSQSGVSPEVYRRIFTTRHGRSIAALGTATGHTVRSVSSVSHLEETLDAFSHIPSGVKVIIVANDRVAELALHHHLAASIAATLTSQ